MVDSLNVQNFNQENFQAFAKANYSELQNELVSGLDAQVGVELLLRIQLEKSVNHWIKYMRENNGMKMCYAAKDSNFNQLSDALLKKRKWDLVLMFAFDNTVLFNFEVMAVLGFPGKEGQQEFFDKKILPIKVDTKYFNRTGFVHFDYSDLVGEDKTEVLNTLIQDGPPDYVNSHWYY